MLTHSVTVTLNNGEVYEVPEVDTQTLAGILTMAENAQRPSAMLPLEAYTSPGPQRRVRHTQVHVKCGHISSVQAVPSLWIGVLAMFLEPGTVWEVEADHLGTGIPTLDTLVHIDAIDGDKVTMSMVSTWDGENNFSASVLPLDVFVEVTTPVSVDRLHDHGVTLDNGETLGRWPTDAEMRKALAS